ncbi:MAG: hypothetical protein JNJ54_09820 [Myxococcaceae bacterium]|nr:hypothetical protein [Myxococcaceae bacterium]
MRTPVCVALVLVATVSFSAPKKKPKPVARPAASSKQAIVVDAPPAMAKLLQSTLGARFSVTVNRDALSDQPLAKEVRTVTAPVKAIAVVMARSAGDSWSLTVLNGADGTPLENQVFRAAARKPLKELPKSVAGAIALACATGQAPSAEKPDSAAPATTEPARTEVTKAEPRAEPKAEVKKAEPKKVEPAKSEPAPEPERTTVSSSSEPSATPSTLPALRMGLGFRGFGRSLTWAGDPEQALARYALRFAPAVAIHATWYPGAHFTSGIASNLGLAFMGDIGIGISSSQDTSRWGTRADRFRISGAFRQPFGSVFSLEAVAGVSLQRYSIDPVAANDGTPRPNIPSVAYVGPRAGVGVRLAKLGPIEVDAMGGIVILTSTGELGTEAYFRRAGGFGVDASAGVAVQLIDNLQLRAAFDWTRYFLSLRPEEGARFVAPSAADQFLGGSVALQWVM